MGKSPAKKGFNRNHLIIMALGNIIGSGIFLGSGSVISLAGPAAVLSYILPSKIFVVLAGASGFTAMFNWLTISITHFFYRRKTLREKPEKLKYKVPGYPYTTVLAGILIIIVFATSPLYPGQVSGLIGSIILFLVLIGIYLLMKSVKVMR